MRTAIATAVLGGCISIGAVWAADPVPATFDLPPGVTPKELNDQRDERAALASAANAALTKGGFDDLCERLTSADQKRFGTEMKRDTTELDGRIEQISKIWYEKYGQKFDMSGKVLEQFVVIREGEVTDPTLAKTRWPVAVTDRAFKDNEAAKSPTSAEYLEKGRNVAVVRIPASHGMPAMTISMLHEAVDDWRMDIPDSVSGTQVFQNLKDRLTKFGDNVSAWPADMNEAYRQVAHSVYASVYNLPQRDFGDKAAGVMDH